MNEFPRQAGAVPMGRADMAVDAGLRSFMVGVFNKMSLGLLLSAALAYAVGNYPPLTALMFGTPLGLVVMFAPLVIMLIVPFAMRNPSPTGTAAVYWTVVSLMGLGLGSIFLRYEPMSIATTFVATSAAFGGLALWGYTTKKDLTGFGSFLIMGLIGLIVASLVNMVLPMLVPSYNPTVLSFVISAAGVLIFAGLTAYDTQKLKFAYFQIGGDERALGVATNYGALTLYLDFVNLFLFLLRFMGDRR